METTGHTHRYDVAVRWQARGTSSHGAYRRQHGRCEPEITAGGSDV